MEGLKIALISTFDQTGGAAIACHRLMTALTTQGAEPTMLVQRKSSDQSNIISMNQGIFQNRGFLNFALERALFLPYEKSKALRFKFSPGNVGQSIAHHKIIQEADVIHIHWFNQAFISLEHLKQLGALGKPLIWTLHDMWAFTGGCHYNDGCIQYQSNCGHCPLLSKPSSKDLSYRLWQKRSKLYQQLDIQFVTCSNWLKSEALKSDLIQEESIQAVPNPIDTDQFRPLIKNQLREEYNLKQDTFYILFLAMKISDPRKGFHLLKRAIETFSQRFSNQRNVEIIVVGEANPEEVSLPFKTHFLGRINEASKIVEAYNLADVFILPSLQDNLPNTVMEALSCGVPVVAFQSGGVPDMVNHLENGYLADAEDTNDLCEGMLQIYENENQYLSYSNNARSSVLSRFSFEQVSKRYLEVYEKAGLQISH